MIQYLQKLFQKTSPKKPVDTRISRLLQMNNKLSIKR